MNLKHLNDQELLTSTEKAVKIEREALTVVLHHLKEVERRRLFSALKCTSLFDYAVKKLGYSEREAYARIGAMKLLNELPEIEEKIHSGSVSLTNISLARTLFNQEQKISQTYNREDKLKLIQKLENKSTREAERIVFAASSLPTLIKPDRSKTISNEHVEFNFTGSEALQTKINKLKNLLAHSNPHISMAELINKLCDLGLEKWDPITKNQKKNRLCRENSTLLKSDSPSCKANSTLLRNDSSPLQANSTTLRSNSPLSQRKAESLINTPLLTARKKPRVNKLRSISAATKRAIWLRDQGRCQNCGSSHAIEYDHIRPVGLDGDSTEQNLRLLCRSCNQYFAIKTYGLQKLERFI